MKFIFEKPLTNIKFMFYGYSLLKSFNLSTFNKIMLHYELYVL